MPAAGPGCHGLPGGLCNNRVHLPISLCHPCSAAAKHPLAATAIAPSPGPTHLLALLRATTVSSVDYICAIYIARRNQGDGIWGASAGYLLVHCACAAYVATKEPPCSVLPKVNSCQVAVQTNVPCHIICICRSMYAVCPPVVNIKVRRRVCFVCVYVFPGHSLPPVTVPNGSSFVSYLP